MAKIVLVAKEINSITWQLATALRSQQHEIVFVSSYDQSPPENNDYIQVLTFLKTWSWFEGLKILPLLLGAQPQIIQLLPENEKLEPAFLTIAAFAKAHPGIILTTSLMKTTRSLRNRKLLKYLLAESDIVTCPSAESMAQLRGIETRIRNQGRVILPPMLNLSEDIKTHSLSESSEESLFIEKLPQQFVLMPFYEKSFSPQSNWSQRFIKICKKYHVVLLGSMNNWSPRERKLFQQWCEDQGIAAQWTLTGVTPLPMKEKLLQLAQVLWLAGCDLSSTELIEHYMMAIHNNCTLVLDHRQAQVHAALWKHGENSWILNAHRLPSEIDKVLKFETLKTPIKLNDSIAEQRHWMDLPLNELNRLFNKALMKL